MTNTQNEPVELLPCPFCGAPAIIEDQPSYSQAANTYFRFRAWCNDCCFGLDWHDYEAEAIAAWNTRATDKTLAEKVKDHLRGSDGDEYTDAGMEDAFFHWPVVERAILAVLEGKRT